MSNPFLESEAFTNWLKSAEAVVKHSIPEMWLEANTKWKKNGTYVGAQRMWGKLPAVANSHLTATLESDEWVQIQLRSRTRVVRNWCWVCLKDDPTDSLGRVKEGAIIVPYKFDSGLTPSKNYLAERKAFYFCGNIFDEFQGLGFLDPTDASWLKIRDRKRQETVFNSNQLILKGDK